MAEGEPGDPAARVERVIRKLLLIKAIVKIDDERDYIHLDELRAEIEEAVEEALGELELVIRALPDSMPAHAAPHQRLAIEG